jgi:replicative DNA helicase
VAERKASPHNWETERSLLGGLLLDPDQLVEVRERVTAADFHKPAHEALYALMCELADAGQLPDTTLVLDEIARRGVAEAVGGAGYVAGLPGACPSVENLQGYGQRVHDHAVRRRLLLAAETVIDEVHSGRKPTQELLDTAEKSVFEISQLSGSRDWHPLSTVLEEQLEELRRRAEQPGDVTGVPTGFIDLDRKLAGLHAGQLIILAARPAMGKTAFALNIALQAAQRAGAAVGVFSLEMARQELVSRMLTSDAMVDGMRVRTGKLDDEDWRRLLVSSERLRELPIAIDDMSGLTISQLRSKARRLKAEYPDLKVLIIDYLQLMQGPSGSRESREQIISAISRGLKILAKELEITVIALSQLNRGLENRPNKRPIMSDLRESGAIEQDADVILFIYRDEVYNEATADKGVAEIIIAKQRAGEIGTVRLTFVKEHTAFRNHTDRDGPVSGYY